MSKYRIPDQTYTQHTKYVTIIHTCETSSPSGSTREKIKQVNIGYHERLLELNGELLKVRPCIYVGTLACLQFCIECHKMLRTDKLVICARYVMPS